MKKYNVAAVITAGGTGERLRPITDTIPKPCVPVGNGIAMTGAVRMLSECGAERATVTVRYKYSCIIDHFYGEKKSAGCGGDACELELGRGRDDGENALELEFFIEEEQLGNAGGVKAAAGALFCGRNNAGSARPAFDVLVAASGDVVCDYSLSEAIAEHMESGADATLLLAESDEPWLYGVVKMKNERACGEAGGIIRSGDISGFVEKPRRETCAAGGRVLISAGIYLLSPRALDVVPDGEYDFGRELFPKLLREGYFVRGIQCRGYWRDVGTPSSYRSACFDAAAGRIRGYAAEIEENGAVTGENCAVGAKTTLYGCVLHDGVTIGADTRARDAVFCAGVSVGSGVYIGEDAVIGAGSVIGDGTYVPCGARIAPNTKINAENANMIKNAIEGMIKDAKNDADNDAEKDAVKSGAGDIPGDI